MGYVINQRLVKKAKKQYACSACEWLYNHVEGCERWDMGMTIGEIRQYIAARDNKFKIQIGQSYIAQMVKEEGEIMFLKVLPDIQAICERLKLYDESN